MKILHTADLHIGQDFYHNSRLEEHQFFFEQLKAVIQNEQPDAWVVSGDVFHSAAPSTDAIELYTHALLQMHEACPTMKIIITAGNHDSPSRLAATREVWQLANVTIVGSKQDDLDAHIIDVDEKGYIIAAPYIYMRKGNGIEWFQQLTARVKELNKQQLPVVLTAHCYITGADVTGHDNEMVGGLENINTTDFGTDFDYLAAGHIHRPQTLGYPTADEFMDENTGEKETDYPSGIIRYSGSAVHVSFDEDYPHSISVVTINKHGTGVHLKRIRINELFALKAVGKNDPKPLEDALEELRELEMERNTYICLHVLIERYLQDKATDEVNKILGNNPKAHFCDFMLHRDPNIGSDISQEQQKISVNELRNMSPLEFAQRYYGHKHYNKELQKEPEIPQEMKEKLIEIINSIEK